MKKKIICIILAIVMSLFAWQLVETVVVKADGPSIETIFNATNTYNLAGAVTKETNSEKYHKEKGYDNPQYEFNFDMSSKNNNQTTIYPYVTVFTHGYNSSSSDWCNNAESLTEVNTWEDLKFLYTTSSMVYQMATNVFSGNTIIIKATVYKESDIAPFFELALKKVVLGVSGDALPTISIEKICSEVAGKHLIVIFEGNKPNSSNANMYYQFNYMLSSILYKLKDNYGGKIPKVNLIGHSRGGLTNLQYALDHPDIVENLISIGTPYFGSTSISIVQNVDDYKGDGLKDLINPSVYKGYRNTWNDGYENMYSKINAVAIGAYSTLPFLAKVAHRDRSGTINFWGALGIDAAIAAVSAYKEATRFKFLFESLAMKAVTNLAYKIFPQSITASIVELLANEIVLLPPTAAWLSDAVVSLNSQLAIPSIGMPYKGFKRKDKCFSLFSSHNLKRIAQWQPPVVHNLEPWDEEIIGMVKSELKKTNKSADKFEYYATSSGVCITGIKNQGESSVLEIPSTITVGQSVKTVTEIAAGAFGNNMIGINNRNNSIATHSADNDDTDIKTLIIPASVKKIGNGAFKGMSNLETVVFADGDKTIKFGTEVFAYCPKLKEITLPSTSAEIPAGMFKGCVSLESISVPSSVTKIGSEAFSGCNNMCFTTVSNNITEIGEMAFFGCKGAETINISSNVNQIGDGAFADISDVKEFVISSSNEKYHTSEGVVFSKDLSEIVQYPKSKNGGSFTANKNGLSGDADMVTTIHPYAFYGCENLTSVNLTGIEAIGELAFAKAFNITNIIAEGLEDTSYGVFSGTSWLEDSAKEKSQVVLGKCLILYADVDKTIVESNDLDESITGIAGQAFASSDIESICISGKIKHIGENAFLNAVNLQNVYFDEMNSDLVADLKSPDKTIFGNNSPDLTVYLVEKDMRLFNNGGKNAFTGISIEKMKRYRALLAISNGESRKVTTDEIAITFNIDPGENFGVNNVYTNGANVDAVSGSGTTRVITISEVTVKDGEKLKLTLKPAGDYYFVNREIEVAVCVKVCKIFYYEAGKNFFSGDISDCPTEYMEGQTTKLVTPMKFGFEFDGWHLNEDGSGERIYNITPDYRGNITLYAKWERNDALSWEDENFKIMYYTEKSRTDNLDILFKSEDGFGDLSYYVREALFPALAQLRVDGYGYELNSTLISAYYPDDDKMSATIVLNDGLKFSSDNNLTANDFKTYYDFVVNAYEDLPKPLKHILGVEANDSRTLEIFLTRPYDIMYVLSELRAVDSELLGEISGMTIEEANACVYAMAADVVTYGRYKIGEISEAGGIFLMPNEKYTFYNENSAYDITLYICDDVQEAGAKYFSGETDACYNFNAEDASDLWAGEETHAYDDRVRMYLALNSTAFPRGSESDKQTFIYALGLLIDYDLIKMVFSEAEHENNKWFPDGYPFEGLPVDEYFDDEWVSGINYQSDIADRQAKARMIFNDELKINPRELVLTINVKNEERYIILADILKNSFDAVDIMLEVNYVETEEEANDGDLFFVFYDFTGKVIPDENFLENDNISIIFTLCGDVDEEFIRRLTEEYEEAETEEKKLEILGEIQNIMAFYVIKINHIDKYYLADPEYFEFTNGHPANLVY